MVVTLLTMCQILKFSFYFKKYVRGNDMRDFLVGAVLRSICLIFMWPKSCDIIIMQIQKMMPMIDLK